MTFSLSSSSPPSLKLTNYSYWTTLQGRLWTGCCFIFVPVIRTSFLSRHFTISKLKDTAPTNACASYNSIERENMRSIDLLCNFFFIVFFQWINNNQSMYMENFLPLCFHWYLQKRGVLVWIASFRERCIAYRYHKSISRDYFELIKCFVSLFAVTFKLSCHVGWMFQVMCLQSV